MELEVGWRQVGMLWELKFSSQPKRIHVCLQCHRPHSQTQGQGTRKEESGPVTATQASGQPAMEQAIIIYVGSSTQTEERGPITEKQASCHP